MGNLSNYLAQAKQQTAGSYNAQKAQLQSAYNDQLAQYGNSVKDINTNYTSSVDTANRNNQNNLNSYNNNVLSRGLARSSIASTGLAGINNTNARVLGELASTKNNQLDRINSLKETLRNNLNSSLTAAQSQYDSNAYTLANQLMQRDEDVAYRNQQLAEQKRQFDLQQALQRQQMAAEQAYRQQQLALQRQKLSSSATSQKQQYTQYAWQDFADNLSKGNFGWLGDNRQALIDSIGNNEVNKMDGELTKKEKEYYQGLGYMMDGEL